MLTCSCSVLYKTVYVVRLKRVKFELFLHVSLSHLSKGVLILSKQFEDGSQLLLLYPTATNTAAWREITKTSVQTGLKGKVHPKMRILSSFTQPRFVPNLHDFFTQMKIFWRLLVTKKLVVVEFWSMYSEYYGYHRYNTVLLYSFTLGGGGGGVHQCAASTCMMRRQPCCSRMHHLIGGEETTWLSNQCMEMIRRPWWSEANGEIWPGCRGYIQTWDL